MSNGMKRLLNATMVCTALLGAVSAVQATRVSQPSGWQRR